MSLKSPRERAARALCRLYIVQADMKHEGRPMWMKYLEEVDTVLAAALSAEDWEKLSAEGPEEAA